MSIEELRAHTDQGTVGEVMAFRMRMRELYALVVPYTEVGNAKFIATLLGITTDTVYAYRCGKYMVSKRAWHLFRLAEITARTDPQALADYINASIVAAGSRHRNTSVSGYARAMQALEATATVEDVAWQ